MISEADTVTPPLVSADTPPPAVDVAPAPSTPLPVPEIDVATGGGLWRRSRHATTRRARDPRHRRSAGSRHRRRVSISSRHCLRGPRCLRRHRLSQLRRHRRRVPPLTCPLTRPLQLRRARQPRSTSPSCLPRPHRHLPRRLRSPCPRLRRAAAAASASAEAIDSNTRSIENTLARYRKAFSALDASAARAVWPTVNQRTLSRAFERLEKQDVSFEGCQIDVAEARAEANCIGTASYVPRIGNRTPQVDRRLWRFSLVEVARRMADWRCRCPVGGQ